MKIKKYRNDTAEERTENSACSAAVNSAKNVLCVEVDPLEIDGEFYEVVREVDGTFTVKIGPLRLNAMDRQSLELGSRDEIKWGKIQAAVPVTILKEQAIWHGTAYGLDSVNGAVLVEWRNRQRQSMSVRHDLAWLRRLDGEQLGALVSLTMEQKRITKEQQKLHTDQQKVNEEFAKFKEEHAIDIVAQLKCLEEKADKVSARKARPKVAKPRKTKEE